MIRYSRNGLLNLFISFLFYKRFYSVLKFKVFIALCLHFPSIDAHKYEKMTFHHGSSLDLRRISFHHFSSCSGFMQAEYSLRILENAPNSFNFFSRDSDFACEFLSRIHKKPWLNCIFYFRDDTRSDHHLVIVNYFLFFFLFLCSCSTLVSSPLSSNSWFCVFVSTFSIIWTDFYVRNTVPLCLPTCAYLFTALRHKIFEFYTCVCTTLFNSYFLQSPNIIVL